MLNHGDSEIYVGKHGMITHYLELVRESFRSNLLSTAVYINNVPLVAKLVCTHGILRDHCGIEKHGFLGSQFMNVFVTDNEVVLHLIFKAVDTSPELDLRVLRNDKPQSSILYSATGYTRTNVH